MKGFTLTTAPFMPKTRRKNQAVAHTKCFPYMRIFALLMK